VTTIQYSISPEPQLLYDMINSSDLTDVAPTTSADASDGQPSVYLTPDALIEYCQTRLQGIDSQIGSAMNQQQSVNWEQSQVQTILTEISTDEGTVNKNGDMTNVQETQALEQNIENLIEEIKVRDPDCAQLGQLEQLHDDVMATGTGPYTTAGPPPQTHGYYCSTTNSPGDPPAPNGTTPPANATTYDDGKIDTTEFQAFTSTLTGINNNLSSGAELQMINIQSLMSQRTTAIQLTTNILQAYDDGLSKVADNIGK